MESMRLSRANADPDLAGLRLTRLMKYRISPSLQATLRRGQSRQLVRRGATTRAPDALVSFSRDRGRLCASEDVGRQVVDAPLGARGRRPIQGLLRRSEIGANVA
jgi:hypothetical protein